MPALPSTPNLNWASYAPTVSSAPSSLWTAMNFGASSVPSATASMGGGGSKLGGMSGDAKANLAAVGAQTLASLLGTFMSGRTASKGLKSQEQMMREQMAQQERILAEQSALQKEYYAQLERQWQAQQENERLSREVQRQQFERSQGFQERQYDERKSAARPYYDYVWNYLNTPVK